MIILENFPEFGIHGRGGGGDYRIDHAGCQGRIDLTERQGIGGSTRGFNHQCAIFIIGAGLQSLHVRCRNHLSFGPESGARPGGDKQDLLSPFLSSLVKIGARRIVQQTGFFKVQCQKRKGHNLKYFFLAGHTADQHVGQGYQPVTHHFQQLRPFISKGATAADNDFQFTAGYVFHFCGKLVKGHGLMVVWGPDRVGISGCFCETVSG